MKPSWISAPATRLVLGVLKKQTSSKLSASSSIGWQVSCCSSAFRLAISQEPPGCTPSMPPGRNAAGAGGSRSPACAAPNDNKAPNVQRTAADDMVQITLLAVQESSVRYVAILEAPGIH